MLNVGVEMKIRSRALKVALAILLTALTLSLIESTASGGSIKEISIEENPLNETAVSVTVKILVEVNFDSPGQYTVLIKDDGTGDVLTSSFRYSVGAVTDSRLITLHFERPADPGTYSYSAIIKMKDSSSDWFDADVKHFTISVPEPETITNVTTVTVTETVTAAFETTQNVTLTETETVTVYNVTTATIVRRPPYAGTATTIVRSTTLTETTTVTNSVTETSVLTVIKTVQPPRGVDYGLVGLGVIGGLIIGLLLLVALRRR